MKHRPVKECFCLSEEITPMHILYNDFLQERNDISKFWFYVWLEKNELKASRGKAKDGNLGYGLMYISNKE